MPSWLSYKQLMLSCPMLQKMEYAFLIPRQRRQRCHQIWLEYARYAWDVLAVMLQDVPSLEASMLRPSHLARISRSGSEGSPAYVLPAQHFTSAIIFALVTTYTCDNQDETI